MPLLRHGPAADPCPHVAAFRAMVDDSNFEAVKDSIATHAATCPACRELQQRLMAFNDPMPAGHDAEWELAEARLDNWMKGFLESERAAEKLRLTWWERLTALPAGWQARWVLIPAAACAVLICSLVVARLTTSRPAPLTAVATPRKNPFANPVPWNAEASHISRAAPRTRLGPVTQADAASNALAESPRPVARAFSAPATLKMAPGAVAAPADLPRFNEEAPPANAAHTQGGLSFAPAVPVAAAPAPPPPPPQATSAPMPSNLVGALRPASAVPMDAAAARAKRERASVPPPPAIRLEAGTRVWITLQSIQPRADGASDFSGVLLLPITKSGAVLFDRNTEVSGIATASGGKRSVRILEFRSAGARFRLQSAGGAANLRQPEAGEVVEFEAGKVLEAWIESASTYQKLPAESKSPE